MSQAWGRPGRILPTASRTIPIVGWGRDGARPGPRGLVPAGSAPGRGGEGQGGSLWLGPQGASSLSGEKWSKSSFGELLGIFCHSLQVWACLGFGFSVAKCPPFRSGLDPLRAASPSPLSGDRGGSHRRAKNGGEAGPRETRAPRPLWYRAHFHQTRPHMAPCLVMGSTPQPQVPVLGPRCCPPAPRGTRAPGPTASLRWHTGTRWPRPGGLRSCRAGRRGNPKVFGVLLMDGSVRRGRGGGGGERGPVHKQLEL